MSSSNAEQQPPVTRALAQYACATHAIDFPANALELARRSLIDTVGVTVAAATEEAVHILQRTLAGSASPGSSTVLFDGTKTDVLSAALLNGTAAHALDYDHGANAIHGHPGAILWPAILAVGEEVGASGRALLEAYLVGFTVNAAIARGLDLAEHYIHGWHATSSTGVFGSAAAAARLMGLDAERTAWALGIAGSMAAGSRQNFGTMTKALHTGRAARDGVLAAKLAAQGFTADQVMLEGPLGYFALYCEKPNPADALEALNGPLPITAEFGIGVKSYACCYCAHRAISAALELRQLDRVDPAGIKSIHITLEPRGFESLIHHRPVNSHEGKFSGEYAVATALHDGFVRLSSFTDEAVMRPEVQRLVERTTVEEREHPPVGSPDRERKFFAVITVTTKDGTFTRRIDNLPSDKLARLDAARIDTKFHDCVAFSNTGIDSQSLLAQMWAIESEAKFIGFKALRPAANSTKAGQA